MRKTKTALLNSILALLLSVSMLLGTTFAWFTDSVESKNNLVVSGNLDVELEYLVDGNWVAVEETTNVFEEGVLWEPGHTEVVYLRIINAGQLALKYALGVGVHEETPSVNMLGNPFKISDHIRYGVVLSDTQPAYADRDAARAALTESKLLKQTFTSDPNGLPPAGNAQNLPSQEYAAIVVYMPEEVGNEANPAAGAPMPSLKLSLSLVATQQAFESDGFSDSYDIPAQLPDFGFPENTVLDSATAQVTVDGEGKVVAAVDLQGSQTAANVPAGVQLESGATELKLTVNEVAQSEANVTLGENEDQRSLDVHIEGVAADNTVPMTITLPGVAPQGMNGGNLKLYHVENGNTVAMTPVAAENAFTAHNQFKYDPATGDLTLYMATFSEVAMVADTENGWNGERDYSWYDNSKEVLTIANADQLAAFGTIVGGMDGKEQDSFDCQTVKLICDININDIVDENGLVFYPVGYYNNTGSYTKVSGLVNEVAVVSGFQEFHGIFDGNGHTVSNLYQNTWEMFGDYNDGYTGTPNHYRDGMGLFGKVYGGTVKNLTVDNFQSDGEYTTTGVIAAYADSAAGQPAVFENIAITNCNPRVYNIGNGGIVGCGGWYSSETTVTDAPITFRNITVDNTNKISALWGSWDVSCAGLLGQYYPDSGSGVYMEDCHVAAQIDVYNDVCANYQYYAYRYAGMLIGSVRNNVEENGHVYPDMTGITASGCTVHFGDWNDYYYCELVDNSLASYTHDHQMSRLVQIDAEPDLENRKVLIKGESVDIPTSGRANYVLVKQKDADGKYIHGDGDAYAECYHFLDGAVWDHAQAGTEEVDGETVLKEDKQHIYREFDQLITGYGWGVTSKGINDMEGVKILDREDAGSVEKFQPVENGVTVFAAGTTVTVGELFAAKDSGVAIVPDQVQVFVSPVGDVSTVSGVYTADPADWTKGTLTLSGRGEATVSITDYNYCVTTTLHIAVLEGDYYIATLRDVESKYWYMTNQLTTNSNTPHYTAKEAEEVLPSVIEKGDPAYTFQLIRQGDNTFKIKTGDQYLGWNSENSGILVSEADAKVVTIVPGENSGTYNIFFASSASEIRYLSLNSTRGNDYFAWYKGTQKQNLFLIPVQPCEHTHTTTASLAPTCTEAGYTDRIICDDCGAVVDEGTTVPALNHPNTTTTSQAATCTEDGYTDRITCDDCGAVVDEGAAVPALNHPNTTTIGAQAATCTEAGCTGTVTCDACGEVVEQSKEIPALGHSYGADNICTACGDVNVIEEKKYTFSEYPAGTQYAENEVHVLDADITVVTTQCHFMSELRIYSSSTHNGYVVIQAANGKNITGLSLNAGNEKDTLNVYGSNDGGQTWTLIQGVSVTSTTYKDYEVDFGEAAYKWLKLDVAGSNQIRLKSMTVTLESTCFHTNTSTTSQNATCTEAGYTDRVICDDCGAVVDAGEAVEALGHDFTGGGDTCSRCEEPNPDAPAQDQWKLVTDVSQLAAGKQIVIVAKDYDYALSTTQNGNNRGQAAVTKDGNTITFGDDVQQLTLRAGNKTDTFAFYTGSGYLYAASSSSNYLRTETTLSDNSSWNIAIAADGTATVVAKGTNTRNTMQYNQGSKLFACYSSASQKAVAIYVWTGD